MSQASDLNQSYTRGVKKSCNLISDGVGYAVSSLNKKAHFSSFYKELKTSGRAGCAVLSAFFKDGFSGLPSRWQKVIASNGDYLAHD